MVSAPPPDESISEIGRALVDDARRLARLEIQLAREEALTALKSMVFDLVLFAMAGLLVLYGAGYALLAIAWKIGILDNWWGWAVSGAALFLLAGMIAGVGGLRLRRTIRRTKSTIDDIKGDAEWLRQLPQRAKSSS